MKTTLDQWEAEAKADFNLWQRHVDCGDDMKDMQIEAQRILALIDLIRKKDEALKCVFEGDYPGKYSEWVSYQDELERALLLTEQLK